MAMRALSNWAVEIPQFPSGIELFVAIMLVFVWQVPHYSMLNSNDFDSIEQGACCRIQPFFAYSAGPTVNPTTKRTSRRFAQTPY